jgi:hypothetical protein
MTRKLAVFVEGLTEQEFTIKLLKELAGSHGISFVIHTQHKGTLNFTELRSNPSPEISVLVANCATDGQVKSQIRDRYSNLKAAGYELIIGLRDVHPISYSEISKLEALLMDQLPVDSVPISMHLAIMEIEAWFIEETSHFSKIDSQITPAHLVTGGFDPATEKAHELENPAKILNAIYKTVGKSYNKSKKHIERTVNAIDYTELYLNTKNRAPSLEKFISALERGVFPQSTVLNQDGIT